jgi:hypothetical protein
MRALRSIVTGLAAVSVSVFVLALSAGPASAAVTHAYLGNITEANGAPFIQPWGLATDAANGNLFVANAKGSEGPGAVDEFDAGDEFTGQVGALPSTYVRSVAVDYATGDVYVAESGVEEVFVFKPEGATYGLLQRKSVGNYMYVAVNNSSGPHGGDVYVISGSATVDVYATNAEGELEGSEELTPPAGGFSLLSGVEAHEHNGGLAVDGANGKVYVAEPGHAAVSEYNSKDELQAEKLTGAQTPAPGSFEPVGVAIDEVSGDVYVVDAASKVIDQFSSSGTYLGQIRGIEEEEVPFTNPLGVTVQNLAGATQGEVYVSNGAAVDVFANHPPGPKQKLTVQKTGTGAGTVTSSPAGIACGTKCTHLFEEGVTVTLTAAPNGGSLFVGWSGGGCAGAGTCEVTLSQAQTVSADFEAHSPILTTGEAQEVTTTSAIVSGTVDPVGAQTTYHFAYIPASEYEPGAENPYLKGAITPTFGFLPSYTVEPVHPEYIGELQPGTTYDYALVATNSVGTTIGPNETFTTAPPTPPQAFTGEAVGVSQTSATLTGAANTNGLPTTVSFEFGTSPVPGTGTPVIASVTAEAGTSVSVAASFAGDLQAGTTYYYRTVASNRDGVESGAERSFTTAGFPALASITTPIPLLSAPASPSPPKTTVPKKTAKPARCKRGFVKKHGKCTRQRSKKARKKGGK